MFERQGAFFKFQTLFKLLNFTRENLPLKFKMPTFEFKDYSLNVELYSLEFNDLFLKSKFKD